jgi:RNA polymerase sigma-70 factor (ECF subfamily)
LRELSTYHEKELLQLVAAGDEQAFAILFNTYRKKLYTNIFRLTGSRETAEDTVHEVFLKIWQNRENAGTIDNFGGYIHRLAQNMAVSGFRRMAKETLIISALKQEAASQLGHEQNDLPTQQLMAKEVKAFIQQAVDGLTSQQKAVYLLSREQGLKSDEIAEKLGISVNTAKKHLMDALKNLRQSVNNTYGPYAVAICVLYDITTRY